MNKDKSINTILAQAGIDTDSAHGAVTPPLYMSTNYSFDGYGGKRRYDYSRCGNPTRDILAQALADLEGGAGAVVTSTGMAAVDLPFQLLTPDDLLLVPHDCYGGTYRLASARAKQGHFKLRFVDQTNEATLRAAFAEKPRMIFVETPSNPLLRLTDFALVTELAQQHGALVVADNTFMSPALQNPIKLGADIVVHSTTKYINGHSDIVGGAVITKTPEMQEELAWWANCIGTTGSAFDSFMTLRGMRTLGVRIMHQQESARQIAEFLSAHSAVDTVYYPGLKSHPSYDLAQAQQKGAGAMLSFELKGDENTVKNFLKRLEHFSLAESLGGFESLVCHPASMTHAAMDEPALKTAGIGVTLIRLSVGLDDVQDLINSLKAALPHG